jgi:hypothetical protein
MRRPTPPQIRLRIGLLRRAASWLLALTLLAEGAVGAGAALRMWLEANASGEAAGHCAEHGAPGEQDHHSDQASHDHERCLLCNTAAADCPAPILPRLQANVFASVSSPPAAEIVAHRRAIRANAPRGPPASA